MMTFKRNLRLDAGRKQLAVKLAKLKAGAAGDGKGQGDSGEFGISWGFDEDAVADEEDEDEEGVEGGDGEEAVRRTCFVCARSWRYFCFVVSFSPCSLCALAFGVCMLCCVSLLSVCLPACLTVDPSVVYCVSLLIFFSESAPSLVTPQKSCFSVVF